MKHKRLANGIMIGFLILFVILMLVTYVKGYNACMAELDNLWLCLMIIG